MEIMSTYKRLQYSPFDIFIIIVGLSCIVLGIHFFNNQPFESDDFREVETFGFISKGNGTRKLGNSLQWFDVNKKSELYYGDVIFANESRDIDIELLDKESVLTVPEDSMIRITKSGDEFNLDVSRGSVLIKTKKNKKINLRDKRGKVRKLVISKNSNVKISSKKSNVIVEALKGTASIAKKNSKIKLKIKKGKVLLVGPKVSKVMNKAQIIQSRVVDPVFNHKVLLTKKYIDLKTIQLSKKDNFKEKKVVPVVNGEIEIRNLDYGRYYVRESDKLGYDEFELKELKPIELRVKEEKKYYQGDDINISWSGRSELMYRVDVESEKPFSKLVQGNKYAYSVQDSGDYKIKITEQKFERVSNTHEVKIVINKDLNILGFDDVESETATSRSIKMKNPRKVKYRIKVTNHNGKNYLNKKTNVESYTIKNLKPGLYSTEVINLKTNKPYFKSEFLVTDKIKKHKTKNEIETDKKKFQAVLKWKRSGDYPKKIEYTVNIFDSKDATTPIVKEKTSKNSYTHVMNKAGRFYWSVSSNEESLVKESDKFEMNLKRPKIGKITTPKIVLEYMEEKDCYQFEIPKSKYVSRYDVFIYSSRTKVKGNWKTMYHKRLKVNRDCIPSKGEGKYFYKYRIEDIWNRKSSFSGMGEIYFPISPLDDF
jgi:hypothetical protein